MFIKWFIRTDNGLKELKAEEANDLLRDCIVRQALIVVDRDDVLRIILEQN